MQILLAKLFPSHALQIANAIRQYVQSSHKLAASLVQQTFETSLVSSEVCKTVTESQGEQVLDLTTLLFIFTYY